MQRFEISEVNNKMHISLWRNSGKENESRTRLINPLLLCISECMINVCLCFIEVYMLVFILPVNKV